MTRRVPFDFRSIRNSHTGSGGAGAVPVLPPPRRRPGPGGSTRVILLRTLGDLVGWCARTPTGRSAEGRLLSLTLPVQGGESNPESFSASWPRPTNARLLV